MHFAQIVIREAFNHLTIGFQNLYLSRFALIFAKNSLVELWDIILLLKRFFVVFCSQFTSLTLNPLLSYQGTDEQTLFFVKLVVDLRFLEIFWSFKLVFSLELLPSKVFLDLSFIR